MVSRLIKVAIIAAIAAAVTTAVISSLPDIKRYLEIKEM